jgi:hypothetical protein
MRECQGRRLNLCFLHAQTDFFNRVIRSIDMATGAVTTLAGRRGVSTSAADGIGTTATFGGPSGIATNGAGSFVVVVRFKCLQEDQRLCV